MSGSGFVAAAAIMLFAAFMAGWFTRWLVARLTLSAMSDAHEAGTLAQALHEAELERDIAREELEKREADHGNEMNQVRAELNSAMEGLRDSRREAADLRALVEREDVQP